MAHLGTRATLVYLIAKRRTFWKSHKGCVFVVPCEKLLDEKMVLTRKQRAEKLAAAIDNFMAIRAVALSAPPPNDPIPVVNLDLEEDEEIAREFEKDREDSVNLLLMCLWCKHIGDADDVDQNGENQGGGDGVNKVTRAQMNREAKAARKKRLECLTEELRLLKKDINVELEKVRAGYGDAEAGSST